jgi:hypothetical protein
MSIILSTLSPEHNEDVQTKIPFIYGVNLDRVTMDTVLYEVKNNGAPQELLQSFLSPFLQVDKIIKTSSTVNAVLPYP